jgi:hypothetical protein
MYCALQFLNCYSINRLKFKFKMKSTVSAVEGLMGFPVCAKVLLGGGKLYYNVNIQ